MNAKGNELMIKKLFDKIFKLMRYREFMRPFVIGLWGMLIVVAIANILMIGNDLSVLEYSFKLVIITIGGHIFLKLYEYIFIFLAKILGKNNDIND